MRTIVIAVSLCLAVAGQCFAQTPTTVAIRSETQIPPQDLRSALKQFAESRHIQVLYLTAEVKDLRTRGASGNLTADETLACLLRGTGLKYRYIDANAVSIIASAAQSGAAPKAGTVQQAIRGRGSRRDQHAKQRRGDPGQEDTPNRTEKRSTSNSHLAEVVVTGTHIRGLKEPIGETSIVITRDQMSSSGYASLPDVLSTLPQNFSGGVEEVQSLLSNDASAGNFNRGTAINLRGLGADSTLVLIDGERLPGSGVNGAFTDVSNIPTDIIERVEVLPYGASAVYGSDAVGGVVNIVLRHDFNGAETAARYGTYAGDAPEVEVSQVLGHVWRSVSVMAAYRYYRRGSLSKTARSFSSSDNLTDFGGSDYRSVFSNPGNILSPATGLPSFAIPVGQDGVGLMAGELLKGQVNYFDSAPFTDLLPQETVQSGYLSVRGRIGQHFTAFSESTVTSRSIRERTGAYEQTLSVPSKNALFVDPFPGTHSVSIDYNFLDDLGAETLSGTVDSVTEVAGISAELPHDWQISATGDLGRERTSDSLSNLVNGSALTAALDDSQVATAFDPFADGTDTSAATLSTIRATQYERAHSYINSGSLRADGPAATLPGGLLRVAAGVDYRSEGVSGAAVFPRGGNAWSLGRNDVAAFSELAIPVVGKANGLKGVRELKLSVAGRADRYSGLGRTFNSNFGMDWTPSDPWRVRGTWGSSFKAPRLIQLDAAFPSAFDFSLPLASTTGPVSSLVEEGNNANLRPETAHVWSAGVDYDGEVAREGISGMVIDATLWDVDYRNVIEAAGPTPNPLSVLLAQNVWSSVITLDPTAAQIAAICNSGSFYGSASTCSAGKYGAIVDLRLLNLAEERVRGVDLNSAYHWPIALGLMQVGLQGTYVLKYRLAVTPSSGSQDLVNTIGHVPHLRLRGNMSWSYRAFQANLYVNVTGGYTDNISIPNRDVSAWKTVDLSVAYKVQSSERWLRNVRVVASAVNVVNVDPPFANVGSTSAGALGYDPANSNPYGRILSLTIAKSY